MRLTQCRIASKWWGPGLNLVYLALCSQTVCYTAVYQAKLHYRDKDRIGSECSLRFLEWLINRRIHSSLAEWGVTIWLFSKCKINVNLSFNLFPTAWVLPGAPAKWIFCVPHLCSMTFLFEPLLIPLSRLSCLAYKSPQFILEVQAKSHFIHEKCYSFDGISLNVTLYISAQSFRSL